MQLRIFPKISLVHLRSQLLVHRMLFRIYAILFGSCTLADLIKGFGHVSVLAHGDSGYHQGTDSSTLGVVHADDGLAVDVGLHLVEGLALGEARR